MLARITRMGHRRPNISRLLLRLGVGAVMAAHGFDKLDSGPIAFGQAALDGLGLPAPGVLGVAVTLTELVGGLAIMAGLATRLAALANAAVLLGVLATVMPFPPSLTGAGALELVLLAGLASLLVGGSGAWSLEAAWRSRRGWRVPSLGGSRVPSLGSSRVPSLAGPQPSAARARVPQPVGAGRVTAPAAASNA